MQGEHNTICLRIIYVHICIWHMFVIMSVVVTVWGSVGMFVVLRPLLIFFSLWSVEVCLCKECG